MLENADTTVMPHILYPIRTGYRYASDTPKIRIQPYYLNLDTSMAKYEYPYMWAVIRYGPTSFLAYLAHVVYPKPLYAQSRLPVRTRSRPSLSRYTPPPPCTHQAAASLYAPSRRRLPARTKPSPSLGASEFFSGLKVSLLSLLFCSCLVSPIWWLSS